MIRPNGALVIGKAALLCATLLQMACSGITSRDETMPPERDAATAHERQLTIAAVGDIMLGTDYPYNRLPPEVTELLSPVAPVLQQADVTFGNLEGVLMDGGEAHKKCSDSTRCYVFRSPQSYATALAEAGFDVMSLANNHARDFGESGRSSSMHALQQAGIRHSGRLGDVAQWQQDGLQLAMIAFAPFGGSHDMLNMTEAQAQISSLAASSDILIVSFHGGAEGGDTLSLPFATEWFHGENRGDVVAFARMAVNAGADLLIGHGPHVPRAMELYRGRLIAYSLGNFATYQGINVRQVNGLAPILLARLDSEGRFIEGKISSNRQQRPLGPRPDPTHQAARLIAQLSEADFPLGLLEFGPEGAITIKPPAAANATLGASP